MRPSTQNLNLSGSLLCSIVKCTCYNKQHTKLGAPIINPFTFVVVIFIIINIPFKMIPAFTSHEIATSYP